MREKRFAFKVSIRKPEERGHLNDLSVDERLKL
jgi:hypothetical protein